MEFDKTVSEDTSFENEAPSSDPEPIEEDVPTETDAPASVPEDVSSDGQEEDPAFLEDSEAEAKDDEKEAPLSSPTAADSDTQVSDSLEEKETSSSLEDTKELEVLKEESLDPEPELSIEEDPLDAFSIEESTDQDLYLLVLEGFQVTNELMAVQIGLMTLLFAMLVFRFVYRLISNMVTKYD